MQGDLGLRKLEERREEWKVMFSKRLEVLDDCRLVKVVINILREDGGIGWLEEYEFLMSKYELCNEYGSIHSWKKRLRCEMRRTGWRK